MSILTYILFNDAIEEFLAGIDPAVKFLVAVAMTLILALVLLDSNSRGGRGMLFIGDLIPEFLFSDKSEDGKSDESGSNPRVQRPSDDSDRLYAVIPGGGLLAYLLDLAIRNWDVLLVIFAVAFALDRLGIYPAEQVALDIINAIISTLQSVLNGIAEWLSNIIKDALNPTN
jgi:hypothetical protein